MAYGSNPDWSTLVDTPLYVPLNDVYLRSGNTCVSRHYGIAVSEGKDQWTMNKQIRTIDQVNELRNN